jgi:hypothetical protein
MNGSASRTHLHPDRLFPANPDIRPIARRLHEHVARRLVTEPALREVARARLQKLRTVNPHGHAYHDRWEALLDGPLPRLLQILPEDSEQANDLRRESPFTTLVDPAVRNRVYREVRAY